jgi:MFS family permease
MIPLIGTGIICNPGPRQRALPGQPRWSVRACWGGHGVSFIPISVAALTGVAEHQSGLASGLLNTSTQIGGAIGTAIASSVAASGTNALLRAGDALPTASTSGFHQTVWMLGAIALVAPPSVLVLLRRARVRGP